ncbi:MAG: hypothetical protein PHY88_04965 [Candidatus Omnitrophica bacterium]|nr:hypothetical protein [Candidatus Omnitrophota bacterium]
MRKYAVILLCGLFILGCAGKPQGKILAKVGNYEITEKEFEEEFRASIYGRNDTPESRREFLNILIDRKLILLDAQKKGLDKTRNFLKMVERFWEQSLLKLALDRKNNEIAGLVFVSDKEVKEAYEAMLKEAKADKPYEKMYQQIKWQLIRQKEYQAMSDWLADLHKNTGIKMCGNAVPKARGEK